ncbi:hypothetical protein TEA_025170 [Camellia sinensis var. sinensis]|uniref:Uncharacterized protein n=1 Tax=Camellia sinensis var. sinensis TaxID=542762 RepID=A0A4S4DAS6_CAMSN|nr:hypothetical protein TEA_025170 [Camellia sinensis var. sinensis]
MILIQIWVSSNPRGAEILPPAIVAAESDFYLRRLWGLPSEDLTIKQKYLVTFTVGYDQRHNIDAAVKKFSENFTILLFHYDGRTTEWNEFEWSKRAIHVSALKQTKWWYAKRFLYPDIVAPYDYIFIWDEDLGVEHFNAEEYIKLVRKHGLEISQPGLEPDWGLTWQMTKRRGRSREGEGALASGTLAILKSSSLRQKNRQHNRLIIGLNLIYGFAGARRSFAGARRSFAGAPPAKTAVINGGNDWALAAVL